MMPVKGVLVTALVAIPATLAAVVPPYNTEKSDPPVMVSIIQKTAVLAYSREQSDTPIPVSKLADKDARGIQAFPPPGLFITHHATPAATSPFVSTEACTFTQMHLSNNPNANSDTKTVYLSTFRQTVSINCNGCSKLKVEYIPVKRGDSAHRFKPPTPEPSVTITAKQASTTTELVCSRTPGKVAVVATTSVAINHAPPQSQPPPPPPRRPATGSTLPTPPNFVLPSSTASVKATIGTGMTIAAINDVPPRPLSPPLPTPASALPPSANRLAKAAVGTILEVAMNHTPLQPSPPSLPTPANPSSPPPAATKLVKKAAVNTSTTTTTTAIVATDQASSTTSTRPSVPPPLTTEAEPVPASGAAGHGGFRRRSVAGKFSHHINSDVTKTNSITTTTTTTTTAIATQRRLTEVFVVTETIFRSPPDTESTILTTTMMYDKTSASSSSSSTTLPSMSSGVVYVVDEDTGMTKDIVTRSRDGREMMSHGTFGPTPMRTRAHRRALTTLSFGITGPCNCDDDAGDKDDTHRKDEKRDLLPPLQLDVGVEEAGVSDKSPSNSERWETVDGRPMIPMDRRRRRQLVDPNTGSSSGGTSGTGDSNAGSGGSKGDDNSGNGGGGEH